MQSPGGKRHNRLLDSLPDDVRARLTVHLEFISLPRGHELFQPGVRMHYVFFPTSATVSLLHVMADGTSSEMALIGSEGVLGIPLFMGGDSARSRAIVQSAGYAYRLRGHILNQEFYRAGAMQRLLLRYTHALLMQLAQNAVCNRHHSLEQQLCRWLLLNLDRVPSNELLVTQELIANMLGVRREGITEAAGKVKRAGLIEYHRGRITVLDRAGLEARACECYSVVKKEFDQLLPQASVL